MSDFGGLLTIIHSPNGRLSQLYHLSFWPWCSPQIFRRKHKTKLISSLAGIGCHPLRTNHRCHTFRVSFGSVCGGTLPRLWLCHTLLPKMTNTMAVGFQRALRYWLMFGMNANTHLTGPITEFFIRAILHDEHQYPEPLKFNPERFEDQEKNRIAGINELPHAAFGFGRR